MIFSSIFFISFYFNTNTTLMQLIYLKHTKTYTHIQYITTPLICMRIFTLIMYSNTCTFIHAFHTCMNDTSHIILDTLLCTCCTCMFILHFHRGVQAWASSTNLFDQMIYVFHVKISFVIDSIRYILQSSNISMNLFLQINEMYQNMLYILML